jgi:hypothetical protein
VPRRLNFAKGEGTLSHTQEYFADSKAFSREFAPDLPQISRDEFEEFLLGGRKHEGLTPGTLRSPGRRPLEGKFSAAVFLRPELNKTIGLGRFVCEDRLSLGEIFDLGAPVILTTKAGVESIIRLTNTAGSFVARGTSAVKLMA